MKTDIYTLLGMIKDGKSPEKIMYRNVEFVYESGLEDYFPIYKTDKFSNNGLFTYLFDEEVKRFLNDEVEILETTVIINNNEHTKIEKIDRHSYVLSSVNKILTEEMIVKINALIDRVNDMEV